MWHMRGHMRAHVAPQRVTTSLDNGTVLLPKIVEMTKNIFAMTGIRKQSGLLLLATRPNEA
jgi:hypothetical protein